jgi:hypothetical protein
VKKNKKKGQQFKMFLPKAFGTDPPLEEAATGLIFENF